MSIFLCCIWFKTNVLCAMSVCFHNFFLHSYSYLLSGCNITFLRLFTTHCAFFFTVIVLLLVCECFLFFFCLYSFEIYFRLFLLVLLFIAFHSVLATRTSTELDVITASQVPISFAPFMFLFHTSIFFVCHGLYML